MGKKEKREEYLEKFAEAFAQSGIDRTSVKKLSAAAGINEASIYQYFKNKDEIVTECVRRYFEAMQSELFPMMTNPAIPLDQRLQRAVLYYAQMEQREKFIIQVLTDPAYQKKCAPFLQNQMGLFSETASRLSAETGIPENILYPMVLMLTSLHLFHRIFNSTDAMLTQLDFLQKLFAEEQKKAAGATGFGPPA